MDRHATLSPQAGEPDEGQRLEALRAYGLLDTPPERSFDDLARMAARLCETPIALVTLVDSHRQWFKSAVGLDLRETPREIAFCAHTLHAGGLLEIVDAALDERFATNPLVTGAPHLRFYAGAPLKVEGGHVLGTLAVLDRRPRRLTEQQREDLRTLARQVVMLLEERRLRRGAQAATREARRQSAALLAIAGRVARLGAWEVDLQTQQVVWSDVVADIHGMPRGFAPQVDEALAFYAEPGRSVLAQSVERCQTLGEPFDHELVLQPKDRAPVWVRSIGEAVRSADGRITHLRGACQDITERKSHLIHMERLAERLASTLEAIPDPFFTFGADRRIQLANASFVDLVQRSRDEVIGQELSNVLIASGFDVSVHERAWDVMDSHQPIEFETVDAQKRRYEVRCFPASDGVAVHARDVTRRDATLSWLRLLDTCIRRLNDAVLITDARADPPGPSIVFANAALEAMCGWRAQELIGQSPRKLQGPLTQRDRLDGVREAVAHCRPVKTELINYRRTGEPYWVELELSPIHDDAGLCTHFVAVERDITERKEAQARQEALEGQLRQSQKMESIGTLAGGIAHDFNNILGTVLGSVTLARDGLPPGTPVEQPLRNIESAALRGRALVQQVLTFGRRHAAERLRRPLQPVLEETLRMLRSTSPPNVTLKVRRPDREIWADIDANQVQQVLLNLCTNAWHALPPDGGLIEVGLDADPPQSALNALARPLPERWAHFWVKDNGTGIAVEVRERIFEPFFTTKPLGQGTGLGLSVAHGIITSHGGLITVDSEAGRGSTFHVHLPSCDAPATMATESLQGAPSSPEGLSGLRVWCVDDDPVMLMTMAALLERQGCLVQAEGDALTALAHLDQHMATADVLVTDYNMPDVDGLALVAAVHQMRPDLPVILASGFINEELVERARSLGVSMLVRKERIAEELVEAVRAAVMA